MTNLAKDPKARSRSAAEYAREIAEMDAEAEAEEREALATKHDTDRMSFEELLGVLFEVVEQELIVEGVWVSGECGGSHRSSDHRQVDCVTSQLD